MKDMGWRGIQNGRLLKLVAAEFDVMITADKGFLLTSSICRMSISR